jgi:hypothetical protein
VDGDDLATLCCKGLDDVHRALERRAADLHDDEAHVR